MTNTAKAGAPSAAPQQPSAAGQHPSPQHTVSHMLGELTWLLTQSPTHKHFTFADMEWMILPPLMLEQYRVFRGENQPAGYATWAYLSEEAEQKLITGADTGSGARLRPDEWKSGDRLWLVDMVVPTANAENKLAEACLADLLQGPLKGKKVKFHRTDPATGKRDVVELGG
ncbi:MAG: toxin-activating lysine-acyltransferase [Pseudomonadota bacterium]